MSSFCSCTWYQDDAGDENDPTAEGWCGIASCWSQHSAAACAAFNQTHCVWSPAESRCVQPTCESFSDPVSCRSFVLEPCKWDKDDQGQDACIVAEGTGGTADEDENDLDLDAGNSPFQTPTSVCYNSDVIENATACNALSECVYVQDVEVDEGFCEIKSCTTISEPTVCFRSDLNCSWIESSAGDANATGFCAERLPNGQSVDNNRVLPVFPSCSNFTEYATCLSQGYCYFVHGGPGCRELDLQCDLVNPILCREYSAEVACRDAPIGCTWLNRTLAGTPSPRCITDQRPVFPSLDSFCAGPKQLLPTRYIVPVDSTLPRALGNNPQYVQLCNQSMTCYSCGAVYQAALSQTLPAILNEPSAAAAVTSQITASCCKVPPTPAPSRAPTRSTARPTPAPTSPAPSPAPTTQAPSRSDATMPPSTALRPTTTLARTQRPMTTPRHRRTTTAATDAATRLPPPSPPPTPAQELLPEGSSSDVESSSGATAAIVIVVLIVVGGGAYYVYRKKGTYAVVSNHNYDNPAFGQQFNNKLLD